MYFLVSWCSLTFLTGSWGCLHKVNSSTAAALGAAHMNHHLVPLSDGIMISVLTHPEKITSQGCLSNPAGSALQLLQPTAGNQSETQPVDLGLMGSCGIALGHTSTGASQGITTVAADKEWSLFAHRLLNSPYSQALRNPPPAQPSRLPGADTWVWPYPADVFFPCKWKACRELHKISLSHITL